MTALLELECGDDPAAWRRLGLDVREDGTAVVGTVAGRLDGRGGRGVERDDEAGAGVGQVVLDLPRLEQRVHRDDGGAGEQRAVEHHRERRHVGQHHAHAVARLHAALAQPARHPERGVPELGVGQRGVVHPQRGVVRLAGGGVEQVLGQVGHAVLPRLGTVRGRPARA